jgi:hypothetical protein
MMSDATPLEVIQAQLAAYNSKDIDALLATYAGQRLSSSGCMVNGWQRGMRRCDHAF